MNEAGATWALVVGIDKYDYPRLRQLEGAVGDAIAAVRWLRALGVPAEQILLHASPTAASEQPLKDLLTEIGRPSYLAATEPAIWASINQLRDTSGSRLFVFLAGHGLYDPQTRRMFLTQEAGVAGAWVNLGMDEYLKLFLSMDFPAQYVFLDGCQNHPYADSSRPTVTAAMHPGVTGYTARPANRLAVCYAASQDQRAAEIEGRGAFLRRLLPALDPANPRLEAVDLDFATGQRTFDLWKAMHDHVIPSVERDAGALVPAVVQQPTIEVGGAGAARGGAIPIYRLPDVPVSEITLTVEPAEAAAALESVRVADREKPFWDLYLETDSGVPITAPIVLRMPRGRRAQAECRARSDAPWDVQTATWDIDTEADQVRPFLFAARQPAPLQDMSGGGPLPTPGESAAQGVERYSVQVYAPDGSLVPAVSGHYDEIAVRLGLPGGIRSGTEVASGVRIIIQEIGPDFEVDAGAAATGRRVVADWAEAIRAAIDPRLAVLATVRGEVTPVEAPNLRLVLPTGGARAIAGVLADLPTVRIDRRPATEGPAWQTGAGRSLADVERSPATRVDPGPVHVGIDLPWGSWSEVVSAPAAGEAVVQVPAVIGTPPLRVELAAAAERQWEILRTSGDIGPLTGTVADGVTSRGRRRLVVRADAAGPTVLTVPDRSRTPGGTRIVTLDGRPRVRFPIRSGWPLAVERRAGGVRVEPLSAMPTPEWDLLVASGRLDALTTRQAVNLTNQKWVDEILGLAGAYAVYAAGDWEYLAIVVRNLRDLSHAGLDVALLEMAVRHRSTRNLEPEAVDRLERAADEGDVPVLRWGVPLLNTLLDRTRPRKGLGGWRTAMARIAGGLSPISVWTAWTEPSRR